MSREDICWMSATDLAKSIRRKRLSPVEVVEDILERIEVINPKINAYVTVTADSALAEAKRAEKAVMKGKELGPLHGVPVSVKDLIFTKGVRTTFGCKLLEDFVPEEDAVCVARLKEAGAILLGKTNTSEFGFKPLTDNLLFGATRNPWNLNKTPGGSSGGAGAAVASGLGHLAVGARWRGLDPHSLKLLRRLCHQASTGTYTPLPHLPWRRIHNTRGPYHKDSRGCSFDARCYGWFSLG